MRNRRAVSHSSIEDEVISLDIGLRMGRITCVDVVEILWTDVLELPTSRARGDPSRQTKSQTSQTTLGTIDHVPPNARESSNCARLCFVHNQAVMKIVIRSRRARTCVMFRGLIV